MKDKILINDIDVTSYRRSWNFNSEWDTVIDEFIIEIATSVRGLLEVEEGMSIFCSRGFVTDDEENVFDGQITQVKPAADVTILTCKGRMYDAVKNGRVKSWERNIDTEGGMGSEIFKSICDHSQLDYTDDTVISTGTSEGRRLIKFIQNDEDDFQKMNELAEHYNYTIRYDYNTSLAHFEPKGYESYPATLRVGTEIPTQLKWTTNMEQLINKVKIHGATVYDKVVESFAGPATEFTLSKTPEDTEVRINSTTTNDLQVRGQRDVGTLGTDFDYYVDVEQKKLVFASDKSNVWINYGAQVPLPIVLSDPDSIEKYGGPNKIPHFKNIFYNDIKDKKDAEDRGRAILQKYATPFIECEKIPVHDDVVKAHGFLKPGMLIPIIDEYNNKDVSVFISGVTKSFPHIYDTITVGDQIWRTENWQSTQMQKINQLFNELNKNQDILIHAFDLHNKLRYKKRYTELRKRDITGTEIGIWGHPVHGIIDGHKYGSVSDLETAHPDESIQLIPGLNTYEDYVVDDTFFQENETELDLNLETNPDSYVVEDFSPNANDGVCKVYTTSYYPFRGNANDEGVNSNDGSVTGMTATTDRFGDSGAYRSTANTDYISLGTHSSLNVTDTQTIIAVIKKETGGDSNTQYVYVSRNSSVGAFSVGFSSPNGATPTMTSFIGTSQRASSSIINLNDDNYHVAIWELGTTQIKYYWDGVLIGTVSRSGTIDNTVDKRIGTRVGHSFAFRGLYDEIIVMNNVTLTDQSAALISEMLLNHKADKTYREKTGINGQTIRGYEFFRAGPNSNTIATQGQSIYLGSSTNIGPRDFSIYWEYMSTVDDNMRVQVLGQTSYSSGRLDMLMNNGNGLVVLESKNNNIWQPTMTTGQNFADGAVRQFLLELDDVSTRLYINGVLSATVIANTDTAPFTFNRLGSHFIGSYSTSYGKGWFGILARPIIIPKVLSTVERTDLFARRSYNTSGTTWNTTDKKIEILPNRQCYTAKVAHGVTYSKFTLKYGKVTGTITAEVSGDGGATWKSALLNRIITFDSYDDTGVILRILADTTGATIENDALTPAISLKLEV